MPLSGAKVGGGPRSLLRRLRDVMASPESAQDRLNQIVRVIAADMVAEVCSIYLLRADDKLELFATEGLKQDAVHHAGLRVGEGLIGDIAANNRTLTLTDAQSHPNFQYLPETGEEAFHSFLGVPIVRSRKVVGVLAVQNISKRVYTEEEQEALMTVAMVIAEMVGQGELLDPLEMHDADLKRDLYAKLEGLVLAGGIGMGKAVLHQPRVTVTKILAEDQVVEEERLDDAVNALRSSIDRMLAAKDLDIDGEHREVLQTYRMFAHDQGWFNRMRGQLSDGLTAEAAVERVQLENRSRMNRITDPYLRERIHDLEDLSYRLMRILAGHGDTAAGQLLPDNFVLVARAMGPAELLDYDRTKLRGVLLEEGSPTSHVAIVARALSIPLIGRVDNIQDRVENGDRLVVDGETGDVFIRPGADILSAFEDRIQVLEEKKALFAASRDLPAESSDGKRFHLFMNAGLMVDLPNLNETGADGIGLFRTELQFMVESQMPKLEKQVKLYSAVLDEANDKPVVFRTLDVGGDKLLPYLSHAREENPSMGWRAIRIALDRPALLRYQIRALLEAGANRSIHLMFPMISEVAEFNSARAIVDRELLRQEKQGRPQPQKVSVGTMLEVPSLGWQLDALLEKTDFISVGSNDLMQFFFAADRGNPRMATRYDLLSPSILSFLRHLVVKCEEYGKPLSICGEAAGRPLEALALIGIGFKSISSTPSAIGPLKQMIRSMNVDQVSDYVLGLLSLPDHSIRVKLKNFAQDHGITI